MRAFIAIDLPESIRSRMAEVIAGLRPQVESGVVRWVRPEATHLTLFFLGEIAQNRLAEIQGVIEAAARAQAPFALAIGGLGCFPDVKRPRVVWLGVEDAGGGLARLQRTVADGCVGLGFAREDRPFHPHLTLGRVGREAGPEGLAGLRSALAAAGPTAAGPMRVDRVDLFRSELRPTGAVYTRLGQAQFVGEG